MNNLPYPLDPATSAAQHAPYMVVPDNIHGGWLVYATHRVQEPQIRFDTREKAIAYAEETALREGVGFTVEEHEAPSLGRGDNELDILPD